MKRLALTLAEVEALRWAVDGIPWLPMDLRGYRAVESVRRKIDAALGRAAVGTSGPNGRPAVPPPDRARG